MAKQRLQDNSSDAITEPEDQQGGADQGGMSSVLRQVTPPSGQGGDQSGGYGLPSLSDVHSQVNMAGFNPEGGRSGETPRERDQVQNPASAVGGQEGGDQAPTSALRRPSSPTPMAGSSFTAAGAGGGGVLPFQPMTSGTDASSLVVPGGGQAKGNSMFGSMGGLKGGGLGVPLDPVSDQQSDPISMLLKLLQRS